MRSVADEISMKMAEAGDNIAAQDSRLIVRFYVGSEEDREASDKEGRPIHKPVERIRILIPGERDYVDRHAWEGDKRRFPKHYEEFKSNKDVVESGTPLSAWPGIATPQIAELAHFNVKTVEQLAAMADAAAQKFMGINALRQRARDFLEAARGAAPLTAMRAELETRDSEIAVLKQQMAQLMAAQHAPAEETVVRRGPGRPPKSESTI